MDVLVCEELHNIALFSLSNLQLLYTAAELDFQFKVTKQTMHSIFYQVYSVTKDSVGAVKAGELLSGQVKLKIRQNASVAEWICNRRLWCNGWIYPFTCKCFLLNRLNNTSKLKQKVVLGHYICFLWSITVAVGYPKL